MKGIENTTMLDIANAAEHGRRTLYTYFGSKSDIYKAIIEQESDRYVESLRKVAESDLEPERKLDTYLRNLFGVLQTRTSPSIGSSLSGWLRLDFQRAQKIKVAVAAKEVEFLISILDEGVAKGCFERRQCDRLSRMLPAIISALENSASSGNSVEDYFSNDFITFTIEALLINK